MKPKITGISGLQSQLNNDVKLVNVVNFSAVTSVAVTQLDFTNYDYDVSISATQAAGATGIQSMRIQMGGTGASPVYFTDSLYNNHTGAVAGSTTSGSARVGYHGTGGAGSPIMSGIQLRVHDNLRLLAGFYWYAVWEGRGVLGQTTTADYGSFRISWDANTWSGNVRVYRFPKTLS